ncbi:MAG: DNA-3-methyladenine glycosylase 2 family protein, partial [Gammaproteobacteria bacterium]
RVPGCWDGLEVGVRAVLGQQVTVKAASTLVSRIVARHGTAYQCELPGLSHVFPAASELARGKLDGLGIVGTRIAAIRDLASQVQRGGLRIDCSNDGETFCRQVCEIPGIGVWTAQYIAMRALNDPNAFPHSDLILRRAVAKPGATVTPKQLLELASSWQPWRAYSVMLLWKHYGRTRRRKPAIGKEKKP